MILKFERNTYLNTKNIVQIYYNEHDDKIFIETITGADWHGDDDSLIHISRSVATWWVRLLFFPRKAK